MKKFFSLTTPLTHIFSLLVFLLLVFPLQATSSIAQEQIKQAINPEQINRETNASNSEATVRKAIDSYVAAFNRSDAKSLAAHWNKAGEYITPAGIKLQGHQQLENDFIVYFKEAKGAKLELPETNLTFLSPNVAIEIGIARVLVPEQEPTETEYKAIYVKTSEGWKIDSIREQALTATPSLPHEQLQSLEWMIGSWVDGGLNGGGGNDDGGGGGVSKSNEHATIETTCRWTSNGNFLTRNFKIFIEDRVDFEGTQIIGWDPHASAIRSWLFDSDGGFGVGHWEKTEDRWKVRTLNVLPDGRRGSSTNIYEFVDENTFRFHSIGRQVDGELLPNIAPVTISRAPK